MTGCEHQSRNEHSKPTRGMMLCAIAVSALAVLASPAMAALEACDRVTHISHGGSERHMDLGAAKIAWVDWWSQEGVYEDVWLADCRTGIALSLRTREERIGDRHVIDRTDRILEKLKAQAKAAPAFFTIERMAPQLRDDGVDLTIALYDDEFCGCAAAYPDMRGDKVPFEVPS